MADRSSGELPVFESPVTRIHQQPGRDGSTAEPSAPGLTLADRSAMVKMLVRAGVDTVAARQLAVPFGAARRSEGTLICGLRPDEWLLLGPAEAVATVAGGLTTTGHVSLIDNTHGRALFRLTGTAAPSVLEKICSLDWDDAMTPNGAVVSASVAKISCDIIRSDGPDGPDGSDGRGVPDGAEEADGSRSYLIACDRSFGQYLFDAIIDAGREFGLTITP